MIPGMGGIDPKQMAKMMKQMGIQNQELDASRVIIELSGSRLVIDNPNVVKISFQGQDSFQISGSARTESSISGDDIKMVCDSTGASQEDAQKALEDAGGDIAQAILKLQEKGEKE